MAAASSQPHQHAAVGERQAAARSKQPLAGGSKRDPISSSLTIEKVHGLYGQQYAEVHHHLTLLPHGTEPQVPAPADHVLEHQAERVLELARPLCDESPNLALVTTKKARCGLVAPMARLVGEQTLHIRASALKDGKWPVVSEFSMPLVVTP